MDPLEAGPSAPFSTNLKERKGVNTTQHMGFIHGVHEHEVVPEHPAYILHVYMYYGLCSVTLSDPSVDPSGGPWKTPRHFITCEHMQQTCNRQTMRIPFFADDRCRSTRCGFSRGLRARHHDVSHLPARFKPLAATVQKTPAERGLAWPQKDELSHVCLFLCPFLDR